jgi:hypothetical protein
MDRVLGTVGMRRAHCQSYVGSNDDRILSRRYLQEALLMDGVL